MKTAIWRSYKTRPLPHWGGAIWGRDRYDAYELAAEWEDAPAPEFGMSLNGGPEMIDLSLPRRLGEIGELGEPTLTQDIGIGQMVTVSIVDVDTGADELVIWRGWIDEYAVTVQPQGEVVKVGLVPLSAKLADSYFVGPQTFTDADPSEMMRWFLDKGYVPGLAWHPTSALVGDTFTHTFEKQTLKEVFDFITTLAGAAWGYYVGPDGQVLFRATPTVADHTLTIGRHVSQVEFTKTATQRRTQVVLYGAGVTATATAAEYDPTNPLVKVEVDDRITDQEVADRIAESLLDSLNTIDFRGTVTVIDNNGPGTDNKGYDIEDLKPGDAVVVVNPDAVGQIPKWGSAAWGEDYYDGSPSEMASQVLRIAKVNYQFDIAVLELSNRQPSQVQTVQDLSDKLKQHMVVA